MNLESIKNVLIIKALKISTSFPGLSWHLFGSVLKDDGYFSDIDIAIIYPSSTDTYALKLYLEELYSSMPIHLVFLSENEEIELSFLKKYKAVRIFQT